MKTNINPLLAAVARAEANNRTDEETAHIDLAQEMGHRVLDVMQDDRYKELTTAQRLTVLAGILGCTIKTYRVAGPFSGALIAAELCEIILKIATEEDRGA